MIDESARRAIAESILGAKLDPEGFATCPGVALHSHRTGRRDFQVMLEGVPTGRCFHSSCAGAVDAFNRELRSRIGKAESGRNGEPARPPVLGVGVPPEPVPPPVPKRPPYDPAKLASLAQKAPKAAGFREWWRDRSPEPVPTAACQDRETSARFLRSLYGPGERVLVFTRQHSQGDFLFEPARGAFRLGATPDISAVPSPLPDGGPEGVWFLTAPVTGRWVANPNNPGDDGAPKLGRRHAACVTAWQFAVLESDTAPEDLWLRMLCLLPVPLCALYTSGGKSVHALVRFGAANKAEWDALRDRTLPLFSTLGADPAALTAVRLSRLPGALRHGTRGADGKRIRYDAPRLQELLWLHPSAPVAPVLDYARI